MSISQDLENYKKNAFAWFDLEIYRAFSDLSPLILASSKVILSDPNANEYGVGKVASGDHMAGLQTKVEKIGTNELGFYLYSSVDYDITILTGKPFEVPMPSTLLVWISQKARRGYEPFKSIQAEGFQAMRGFAYAVHTNMKKRGAYVTQPFNYVGYTIDRNREKIISRFQEIGNV